MRPFPIVTVSLLAGLTVAPARASAQDVDAMAKWAAYEVVHYHFVGAYSGDIYLLNIRQGLSGIAPVTDRVEIDFNWDQNEMQVIGDPVVKNFPSTVGKVLPSPKCPFARVEGEFEMATVTAVADMGGAMLTITSKRTFPAGAIPLIGEDNVCGGVNWEVVAAATVTSEWIAVVPPAMMVVMPAGAGYESTADGKSLKVKGGSTGEQATGLNDWSWTITPTPVK